MSDIESVEKIAKDIEMERNQKPAATSNLPKRKKMYTTGQSITVTTQNIISKKKI